MKKRKRVIDGIDTTILIELNKEPIPTSVRQIGKIINRSHVTVLQRMKNLVEFGYAEKYSKQEAKRIGRVYRISEEGKNYLRTWMDQKDYLEQPRQHPNPVSMGPVIRPTDFPN